MLHDRMHARTFCEVVAILLIADARVTDAERAFLDRLMHRFGLDDADRRAVINSVNIGDSVDTRISRLPMDMRAGLLAEVEAAAMIDGEVAPAERAVLEDIRRALDRS